MEDTRNEASLMEFSDLDNFFNDKPITTQENKEEVTLENFFDENPEQEQQIAEPQTVIVPPTATPTYSYNDRVNEFLTDGDWIDMELKIGDGEETVLISQLAEITPELYQELKELQKAHKEEDFKANYVSVKGLDDATKKMIEIKKAGGDITPLLQIEQEVVHPLKDLDLNNEGVQEMLVRHKMTHLGINPKTIEAEIARMKEDLTLDIEAANVGKEIDANWQSQVDTKLKEQQEFNNQLQEEQKTFKTSLTKQLREFGLKDNLVKNLVDTGAKWDENGLSEADRLFFAAKDDLKRFAEILFHLKDPAGYEEYKSTKVKNAVTVATVKQIHSITPKISAAQIQIKPKDALDEFMQNNK